MIKDNQQHFNRLHVIIDAFVIVVSYIIAWWLKFSSGILDSPGGALSFGFYMKALVVIVPLYLIFVLCVLTCIRPKAGYRGTAVRVFPMS